MAWRQFANLTKVRFSQPAIRKQTICSQPVSTPHFPQTPTRAKARHDSRFRPPRARPRGMLPPPRRAREAIWKGPA
ncbi:hypothetical protein GCM10011395_26230 [Sphingomonas psychrolutea]|uniref:Uncharacterized protein n=1 Tax=Sphingomonas psychrolutea TaxID=1259676 RepID=A0ABQ1H0K8_9SPHN|nr:hypothetical protein GCM10011395_26230 [Sphingomonas psychrolutea]